MHDPARRMLLIMIAVVAILAAVAIPEFIDITANAKKAREKADAGATRIAQLILTITAMSQPTMGATPSTTPSVTLTPSATATLEWTPTRKPKEGPPAPSCSVEPNNPNCVQ